MLRVVGLLMTESFIRNKDADKKRQDAIKVVKVVLKLDIHDKLKRKLLSNCLWQITEAEGKNKYDLRYVSEESRKSSKKGWRHEHVYPRKGMIKELVDNPEKADEILAKAVGCVVTKKEHNMLSKIDQGVEGWNRYQQAGIEIFDRLENRIASFP